MRDDVPPASTVPGERASASAAGSPCPAGDATDAALTVRLAAGDAAALDLLYRRHRADVHRFALLWTGSSALAADVTQDVFMHLLTRARDYDGSRGPLRPWLLGIARNFARQRSGIRDSDALPLDDEGHGDRALVVDDTAVERLIARQDLDRLRRAIAALPPHYRDVLVLAELAERSYAETALICGCELNTVRSRLSRARGLLAAWLAGDVAAVPAGQA